MILHHFQEPHDLIYQNNKISKVQYVRKKLDVLELISGQFSSTIQIPGLFHDSRLFLESGNPDYSNREWCMGLGLKRLVLGSQLEL